MASLAPVAAKPFGQDPKGLLVGSEELEGGSNSNSASFHYLSCSLGVDGHVATYSFYQVTRASLNPNIKTQRQVSSVVL